MGFELFDKPNWVGSEFDEQVNYQRALEGELEHTVATLTDVQSARVHLVMPHESLFRDQERPAKAAVVLTLRHSSLAEGEADSIRNLVSSAVDGLSPAQVSLVDAGGHHLVGPLSSEAGRLAEEQALEAKLIETLEPVTGSGNVRASVTVDYDPTATEETEETYDPDQTVTLAMQRTEQSSGPLPVASGVPGTASNAPNSTALPVYPQQSSQPQTAKSENGTYGVSRKVRHTTQAQGHLRRLTAAIVVNDRLTAQAQKGNAPAWQPRTAEELHNLTALAQSAVGFDAARGDVVTVEDLAFAENRNTVPASIGSQALSTVEHSPVLVKYSALLVGLLLLIVLAIRPALRGANPAAKSPARGRGGAGPQLGAGQKARSEELEPGFAQAALPAREPTDADVERVRVQQVFEQVTDQLKQNPAQSSRLLQSWIHSD
jgi:flagellar M-ring protein FliF